MNEEQKKWDVVPFDTLNNTWGRATKMFPAWSTFWKMERFSISWRKPPAYMNPPIIL